ncbi:GTPase HflX [Turicimonas muris]|uniref:GTPase HflX n=1 Tax=Turicimonas muris TaxID=1796652 RepID=UPI00267562D1|nr:GTPase HflX [Turicimonas muris]
MDFQYEKGADGPQKVWLVVVTLARQIHKDATEELTELARSCGYDVQGITEAKREKPDPKTFLGSGKIEEVAQLARDSESTILIFDVVLSPAQQRNIETTTKLAVLDRTSLILEIFRQRAKTKEGRLQVELARLTHLSTRLVRGWTHLERQRGGLSKTGGPGEKQIELDRRMISVRIKALKEQLKKLEKQRNTQRKSRQRGQVLTVALVGYTNAGKSTLFNRLTRGEVYAADQLFATLDPTARRCFVDENTEVVLSDTVGFIRGLPHQLIEAFKSTLDEAAQADLLLHVVDSSSPAREEQIAEVNKVLKEIGADKVSQLMVYNKIDKESNDPFLTFDDKGRPKAVALSAVTGAGIDLLRQAIAKIANTEEEPEEEDDEDWLKEFEP